MTTPIKGYLVAKPAFELIIPLSLAKLIRDIALTHYDHTCRAAGQLGGFVHGWVNICTPIQDGEPEGLPVLFPTFRELDIVLKIFEVSSGLGLTREQAELIWKFRSMLLDMLATSNKQPRHIVAVFEVE
jgi:hypothetical protein